MQPRQHEVRDQHPEHHGEEPPPADPERLGDAQVGQPDRREAGEDEEEPVQGDPARVARAGAGGAPGPPSCRVTQTRAGRRAVCGGPPRGPGRARRRARQDATSAAVLVDELGPDALDEVGLASSRTTCTRPYSCVERGAQVRAVCARGGTASSVTASAVGESSPSVSAAADAASSRPSTQPLDDLRPRCRRRRRRRSMRGAASSGRGAAVSSNSSTSSAGLAGSARVSSASRAREPVGGHEVIGEAGVDGVGCRPSSRR